MIRMKLLVTLLLFVLSLLLVGCNDTVYSPKSVYFDGIVAVEYEQTRTNTNDSVTFRFYEPGTYQVEFSIIPETNGDNESLPPNFTKTIEKAPREHIVLQYVLPDYLRITITRNGITEFHDFA